MPENCRCRVDPHPWDLCKQLQPGWELWTKREGVGGAFGPGKLWKVMAVDVTRGITISAATVTQVLLDAPRMVHLFGLTQDLIDEVAAFERCKSLKGVELVGVGGARCRVVDWQHGPGIMTKVVLSYGTSEPPRRYSPMDLVEAILSRELVPLEPSPPAVEAPLKQSRSMVAVTQVQAGQLVSRGSNVENDQLDTVNPVALFAPGTIWRIGALLKVDVVVLPPHRVQEEDEVRYRLRGSNGVHFETVANARHWTYVGKLEPCGAKSTFGHHCERAKGHSGDHWHFGDGPCGGWPNRAPRFVEVSRVPLGLDRAIARLKQERGSLSADGARRLRELLGSLQDVVYAAADAARMGQLEDELFGALHGFCRPLLGSVFMVLSGGDEAEPLEERALLDSVERQLVSKPVYNVRLALDERKRSARPAPPRRSDPVLQVVCDHGWDEPSGWAGQGPGILWGRS